MHTESSPCDLLDLAQSTGHLLSHLQDVCSLLGGLAQLGYSPPAPALHAVLAHLGAADRQQAQQPDPAVSGRLSRSGSQEGEVCSAAGCTTKVLELFSCQELAELVGWPDAAHTRMHSACGCILCRVPASCTALTLSLAPPQVGALSRILQRGQYPPPALPPRTVSDFFDQLDTILGARARLARKIAGSPQLRAAEGRARLALSAAHVGGLCWALAGLPQATLT